jgi:hypothetical protein
MGYKPDHYAQSQAENSWHFLQALLWDFDHGLPRFNYASSTRSNFV